jgi:type II secretory pathway pseudopilin PulG
MQKVKSAGFTLIELLLMLTIVSLILVTAIRLGVQKQEETRVSRTLLQMQQILNAGLAFYMETGDWPNRTTDLRGKYLPPAAVTFKPPWQTSYYGVGKKDDMFYVYAKVPSGGIASTIAGKLPNSYVTTSTFADGGPPPSVRNCSATADCMIVASINPPGQNLSNSTSVNFANLYHSGACVPVPKCPIDHNGRQLQPTIFVVPVSVSGAFDRPQSDSDPSVNNACYLPPGNIYPVCRNLKVYPLNSYTAWAIGPKDLSTDTLARCDGQTNPSKPDFSACWRDQPNLNFDRITQGSFWRVCVSITTEKGKISPVQETSHPDISTAWGQSVASVLAITRCEPPSENKGSGFNVWDY